MKNYMLWLLRLVPGLIMLQTLYFKFTGASESVYIFSKLGAEPFGRIGVGVLELVASLLIFLPKTTFYGATLGFGLMLGAISAHVIVLGIEVQNDGGLLFSLALITAVCCVVLLYVTKATFLKLINKK